MSNIANIYNENYGYSVSSRNDLVAIGNPPSEDYNSCEGFGRYGEVFLLKKNIFNKNYDVAQKYVKKSSYYWTNLRPYQTESGSVVYAGMTSSINYESSSIADSSSFSCSFVAIEHDNIQVLQSKFGTSVDLSDYDLAIGDTSYIEGYDITTYVTASTISTVDIYSISDRTGSISCITSSNDDFVFSDIPRCIITGSVDEEFGKSVSISNNYLAIGAPNSGSGSGCVYVYEHTTGSCAYIYLTKLDNINQPRFGFSVAIDKKNESKLIIGTDHSGSNSVYIYDISGSTITESQTLTHNTSSGLFNLQNIEFDFVPISQSIDRFGYDVDINDNIAVVGAPNDLLYYEFEGSNVIRQRGSAYVYVNDQTCNIPTQNDSQYSFFEKLYGDETTFKDNMFGYSVAVDNQRIVIGSPKPYFPFSSLYLSESINVFTTDFIKNDFGESMSNGQVLLYNYTNLSKSLSTLTSDPISYRKIKGEPFSAYGSAVAVSSNNVVVGSPMPLNEDNYLQTPFLAEQSSSGILNCTTDTVDIVQFAIEDSIECSSSIVLGMEGDIIDEIQGKSFVYDFEDLIENYNVGNVFYNNNRLVINQTGSILNDLLKNPTDPNDMYLYMDYRSQLTLNENQYICTVEPGEFNVSTNKTALSNSEIDYAIFNKEVFDFQNLDIILRFINYKLTSNTSENWWDNFIQGEVEESIFEYYSSQIPDYTTNTFLNEDLLCELITKDFDVNNDGRIDNLDGILIWKYFINNLKIDSYKLYITEFSKRTEYDDVITFLDLKTGKLNSDTIDSKFFGYNYSSSLDPTGSYIAPYITTVGLYSGADMVAVAKLAHPIKNTGEIPINFVVKWYN
jgi:hypothetical protein